MMCLDFSGSSSSWYNEYFMSVACSQIREVLKAISSFPTEEFEKYCDDIANTAAWGGQLEVSIILTDGTSWGRLSKEKAFYYSDGSKADCSGAMFDFCNVNQNLSLRKYMFYFFLLPTIYCSM